MESDESGVLSLCHVIEYGPIKVRQIRKPAPTIATGRRPKHFVLFGEEALKREQRREKNREAARKLKEKRQLIEEELSEQLKQLEDEHLDLQNNLQELHQKKQLLEQTLNHISLDPLDQFFSTDNQDIVLLFEQDLHDSDFFDESLEWLVNCDLNMNCKFEKENM